MCVFTKRGNCPPPKLFPDTCSHLPQIPLHSGWNCQFSYTAHSTGCKVNSLVPTRIPASSLHYHPSLLLLVPTKVNNSSPPGTFWLWVSLSGRQALSVDFSPLIFSHESILHSPGHSCSISSSCSFLSSICVFSKWLPSARCVLGIRDRSINGGGRSASWLKC